MVVLRLSQYFIKLTRKKKENIKLIAKTVFLKTQNLSLSSMENKTQSIRISHYFPLCFVFKFLKLLNVADVILGLVYGIENIENNMWASWVEQKCKLILYIFQVN
jgi:hypothetical protein